MMAGQTADVGVVAPALNLGSIQGKEYTVARNATYEFAYTMGGNKYILDVTDMIIACPGGQCIFGMLASDVPAPQGILWPGKTWNGLVHQQGIDGVSCSTFVERDGPVPLS